MKFTLLPKEKVFYRLLETLEKKTEESIKLFDHLTASFEEVSFNRLQKIEEEGDMIVQEIILQLNHAFLPPLDREDIQNLAKKNQDLIVILKTLCNFMSIFGMQRVPEEFLEVRAVLEKSLHTTVSLLKKVKILDPPDQILEMFKKTHALTREGEVLLNQAICRIMQTFSIETIKKKELFDLYKQAIYKCEEIAETIFCFVGKYG